MDEGGCRASASRVRQKPSAVAVAVAPFVRLINVGHLGYVFCCGLGLVCGNNRRKRWLEAARHCGSRLMWAVKPKGGVCRGQVYAMGGHLQGGDRGL